MAFILIVTIIIAFCLFSLLTRKRKKQELKRVIKSFEQSEKELDRMEMDAKIEEIGANIRCVVLSTMDLINSPYPYVLKREIPFIKVSHKNVLEAFNTSLYKKAVDFAYHDIFDSLDSVEGYKSFFHEYTQAPTNYTLNIIKEAIPKEYQDGLDSNLFEL